MSADLNEKLHSAGEVSITVGSSVMLDDSIANY